MTWLKEGLMAIATKYIILSRGMAGVTPLRAGLNIFFLGRDFGFAIKDRMEVGIHELDKKASYTPCTMA